MCFGSPSMPTPPKPPPPPASVAAVDDAAISARDADRKRRLAAASPTILTSPQGVLVPPAGSGKTLLGS